MLKDFILNFEKFKQNLFLDRPVDKDYEEASNLNDVGLASLRKKDYLTARNSFEEAIDLLLRKGTNTLEIGSLYNNLGLIYYSTKKYKKAIKNYDQAIKYFSNDLSANEELASTLNNIGLAYYAIYDFTKAEENVLKSLKIREADPESEGLSDSLYNLGLIRMSQDKFVAAKNLFKKSLAIRRNTLEEHHSKIAASLASIAEAEITLCNFSCVEDILEEALEIKRHSKKDIERAKIHNLLGCYYQIVEETGKAKKNFLQSREMILRNNANDKISTSTNNLALIDLNENNIGTYIKELEENLYEDKELFGEKSNEYISSLNNLSNLYYKNQNYELATLAALKAVKLIEDLYSSSSFKMIEPLILLAKCMRKEKKIKDAKDLLTKSLKQIEETVGRNHRFYTIALNNLAELYVCAGKLSLAHKLFERALKIELKLYGGSNSSIEATINNISIVEALIQKKRPTGLNMKNVETKESLKLFRSLENKIK